MKVLPVAFDSLGVRSMATYVETADVKIFIDPGVSVSPDRYSLPPHKLEIDRHRKMWEDIKKWVALSDIVIVTHYHYDHHNPEEPEIYSGKDVFLKHPRELINEHQKTRAAYFLSRIENIAHSIVIADDQTFNFGKTGITFSKPVFHGLSDRLGYVILTMIEDNSRFIFTSDVQGPLNKEAVDFITSGDPETIYLDGPPTYLLGSYYKKCDIDCAQDNLKKIITGTGVKNMVIDHHLMRDTNWQDYLKDHQAIRNGLKIQSAAGFRNEEEDLLEAKRKDLYDGKLSVVDNYG